MSDIAIRVENLSKRYRIGLKEEKKDTLGGAVVDVLRRPLQNLQSLRRLSKFKENELVPEDIIWALKDVSLEVRKGEVVGIIGRNGAGKTTLLKIISRITEPTRGEVIVRGRMGSLLEVGTGFHPELTGRENIFLNGTILGMNKREIDRNFREILDFSGVGKFIDTPVKRYSSGMGVRLAFAIAAHLEPEILLVDEVLAVGDAQFQKKCLGKMEDISKEGRTVLFVSHNMGAIMGLCKRAVWIDGGKIVAEGAVKRIVADYLESATEALIQQKGTQNSISGNLVVEKVVLRDGKGEVTTNFRIGSSLRVEVHFHARSRINKPYFWIAVLSQYGSLFGANMLLDGVRPDHVEGKGVITCLFRKVALLPQTYTVRMGVRGEDGATILMKTEDVALFNVIGNARELGFYGEVANSFVGQSAPMLVPYEWHLPDGRRVPITCSAEIG
jgi:lipopolysaccharide transport system ATP-binding protein